MTRDRYQAGSVTRVGESWVLRYYERDMTGKRSRPSVVIGALDQYPTKRAALRKAESLMREINDNNRVVYFRNLCDQFELKGMANLRPYTAVVYGAFIRRLRKEFANERLDFMASAAGIARVEEWVKSLRSSRGADRPLTSGTRRRFKALLALMFKQAMKWGHISIQQNPMRLVDPRNVPAATAPRRKRPVVTVEQYHALMTDGELPQICKVAMSIMLITGLRPGETFGLKWSDVDYQNGKIAILRSVKRKFEDAPKTDESCATVPLDPHLAAMLRQWHLDSDSANGYMFESPATGRPLYADNLRDHYLRPAGDRAGIGELGWYNFRHTHRHMMRQAGATLEEMRMSMRHASTTMTLHYGNDGIDHAEQVRPANRRVVAMLKRASGE